MLVWTNARVQKCEGENMTIASYPNLASVWFLHGVRSVLRRREGIKEVKLKKMFDQASKERVYLLQDRHDHIRKVFDHFASLTSLTSLTRRQSQA